ncbi:hypothetical protein LCGC14_1351260 [marine sediment metagenome]|uniref:Uncharacterized protein n=1 Tax=marine sediment metagenome TaxID=412755 RepID=A0A0F9ND61_9ZZZZ
MAWFRRKGIYWYFVEKIDGKEKQHYIGNDQAVKDKLLPNKNNYDRKKIKKSEKPLVEKKEARSRTFPDPEISVTA